MNIYMCMYVLYMKLVAELLQASVDAEEESSQEEDVVDDMQCMAMDEDTVSTASPIPILPLVKDAFT